jgi:hypothetical protein
MVFPGNFNIWWRFRDCTVYRAIDPEVVGLISRASERKYESPGWLPSRYACQPGQCSQDRKPSSRQESGRDESSGWAFQCSARIFLWAWLCTSGNAPTVFAARIMPSKCTTTAQLWCDRLWGRNMQFSRVLGDCRGGLSAAVSFGAVEIQGSDGVIAEGALEGDSAVHSIRCVIAHGSIVGLGRSVYVGQ